MAKVVVSPSDDLLAEVDAAAMRSLPRYARPRGGHVADRVKATPPDS